MQKYSPSRKDGRIALLDSGIGGITVLSEMIKLMPNESYIYFGDLANSPYGEKSAEEIKNITFANTDTLLSMGAKAIVLACNTATGVAAKELRLKYPHIPIMGIEPAIKPAVMAYPNRHILLLATPLTLKQEKFNILYNQWNGLADIDLVPCPKLASLIEEDASNDVIKQYITDIYRKYRDKNTAAIVLGCTHYPLIKEIIKEVFYCADIFDGGKGTARYALRRLKELDLLSNAVNGKYEVITSATGTEAERFKHRAEELISKNFQK